MFPSLPAVAEGIRRSEDLHGSMGKTLDGLVFSGLFESMNPVAVPSVPASLEEALGRERSHGYPQSQSPHCLPAGPCSQSHHEHTGMASHCRSWRTDGLNLASHLSLFNFCLFDLHWPLHPGILSPKPTHLHVPSLVLPCGKWGLDESVLSTNMVCVMGT